MIPTHDLTATLTEHDGPGLIEVTLTYYPAEYNESDPPELINAERWEFVGDTFPPFGDPEGPITDTITLYCIEGVLAVSIQYDGVSSEMFDITTSPFHAATSPEDINAFSRYSSIVVDDPDA